MTPTNPQADKHYYRCDWCNDILTAGEVQRHEWDCRSQTGSTSTPTPQADKQLPPVICGACNTKFTGETAIKQCQDHIKAEHTVEPEQSSNSEQTTNSDDIVTELEAILDTFNPFNMSYNDFIMRRRPAAKDTILLEVDRLVDEVIGPDEAEMVGNTHINSAAVRNQARSEQRKRYEALKQRGSKS